MAEAPAAAPAPIVDFPSFADWQACMNWYRLHLSGVMYVSETHEYAMMNDIIPVLDLARLNATARDPKEKSGIVGQYMRRVLQQCAPRLQGLWLLNSKFITGALKEIKKTQYDGMLDLFKSSKVVAEATPESLEQYKDASNLFRSNLRAANLLPDCFLNSTVNVPDQIAVSAESFSELRVMLQSMIDKREKRLGKKTTQRMTVRGTTVSAGHYQEYYDYIVSKGTRNIGIMDLTARSGGDQGITDNDFPAKETRSKIIKKGPLLLTTAIMQFFNLTGETEAYFDPPEQQTPAIKKALEEITSLRNNVTNNADYAQQCANMDIIFNFYLCMRCLNINLETMKVINAFCYNLGQKFLGKEKVVPLMQRCNEIKAIVQYLNGTGSLYMPPYALTTQRIYDWVAVMGMYRLGDMELFAMTPGVSPRYFSNLKLDGYVAMKSLTTLHKLEGDAEIKSSEHALHQMIIQRRSPYISTLNVKGNAFAVRFYSDYRRQDGDDEGEEIEELAA